MTAVKFRAETTMDLITDIQTKFNNLRARRVRSSQDGEEYIELMLDYDEVEALFFWIIDELDAFLGRKGTLR
jgi:hypothetical protein